MAKTSGPARKPASAAQTGKRGAGTKDAAKRGGKTAAKGPSKPAAKARPAAKATGKPPVKAAAPKAKPQPQAKTAKAVGKPAATTAKKPSQPAAAVQHPAPAGKPGRKGITIVTPKPQRKAKDKTPKAPPPPPPGSLGAMIRKPLIPSGPNAPSPNSLTLGQGAGTPRKTPFNKKQLDRFREILLRKRAELAGDVSAMESEALRSHSGQLSHLPQHMAEQGSDTYDQTLSLDLAAADRRLIKEIDDALARIEAGTYGVCELTGKPIRAERLEELPWARYSIEAARQLERRSNVL